LILNIFILEESRVWAFNSLGNEVVFGGFMTVLQSRCITRPDWTAAVQAKTLAGYRPLVMDFEVSDVVSFKTAVAVIHSLCCHRSYLTLSRCHPKEVFIVCNAILAVSDPDYWGKFPFIQMLAQHWLDGHNRRAEAALAKKVHEHQFVSGAKAFF